MKRIKISALAASELDIRLEVVAVGDEDWPLLAQWDGVYLVAFDAEHAEHLATLCTNLANGLDTSLTEGEIPADDRRPTRDAARGLWGAAGRLRKLRWPKASNV